MTLTLGLRNKFRPIPIFSQIWMDWVFLKGNFILLLLLINISSGKKYNNTCNELRNLQEQLVHSEKLKVS